MSLTDAQWALIEPLLPDRSPQRGGRWRDHRVVIDAIAWKYQSGAQWRCLPPEYGSWKGVYTRLRNWAIDGTWQKVFPALMAQADAAGDLDWVVAVDSQHRAVATCYDKRECIYQGIVDVASIRIWLRDPAP